MSVNGGITTERRRFLIRTAAWLGAAVLLVVSAVVTVQLLASASDAEAQEAVVIRLDGASGADVVDVQYINGGVKVALFSHVSDDLLETTRQAYPDYEIVRSEFSPEQYSEARTVAETFSLGSGIGGWGFGYDFASDTVRAVGNIDPNSIPEEVRQQLRLSAEFHAIGAMRGPQAALAGD